MVSNLNNLYCWLLKTKGSPIGPAVKASSYACEVSCRVRVEEDTLPASGGLTPGYLLSPRLARSEFGAPGIILNHLPTAEPSYSSSAGIVKTVWPYFGIADRLGKGGVD